MLGLYLGSQLLAHVYFFSFWVFFLIDRHQLFVYKIHELLVSHLLQIFFFPVDCVIIFPFKFLIFI